MAGHGVVIQLTPTQVANSADVDPRRQLKNKVRIALNAYNGIRPSTHPVKIRVDLSLHTPDLRMGPRAALDDVFVLGTQAVPDGRADADSLIRLYGWISGRAGRKYLREHAGTGDHVIPPLALRRMHRMAGNVNPTAVLV